MLANGDAAPPGLAPAAEGSDADRPVPVGDDYPAGSTIRSVNGSADVAPSFGMPPSMDMAAPAPVQAPAVYPPPVHPPAGPRPPGPAAGQGYDYAPVGLAAGPAAVAGALRMPPPHLPPASAASSGPLARITAPFSALTRPRTKQPRPSAAPKAKAQQRLQPGALPGGSPQRKAQLVLSRVEPWSVMKFSFMISLVGWVVLFVAVAGIYFVLSKLGVFTQIEHTVSLVTSTKDSKGTNAADWFAARRVLGYTMLAGAVNVVLITALATVGAVVYNLVTHLAGGIEVTLRETD
jgi:hypothetical protein